MTTDRVTVSLPAEIREAAQRAADDHGVPFSTIVSQALTSHLRGLAIDEWLQNYQRRQGVFTEAELLQYAHDAGVPYLPPLGVDAAA